jgi:uncharacterized membrane protein
MALLYNPFLMIHTIAATVALIVGGVLFLRSKGTFAHRRLGQAYVTLMLVANFSIMPVTARIAPIAGTGFGIFHILALVSLFSLIAGCLALWRWHGRRNPEALRAHQINMAFSYLGLVMAFASELIVNRNLGLSPVRTMAQFWILLGVVNIVLYVAGCWLILGRLQGGNPLRFSARR